MDTLPEISETDLTRYSICAKLCGKIFLEVIHRLQTEDITDVYELQTFADNRIVEECSKIYKRESDKGVAFPTCISLNECVAYNRGHQGNVIQPGDVVKIELGINIGGCIAILGKTAVYKASNEQYSEYSEYIRLLEGFQTIVAESVCPGYTTDDLRMTIESMSTQAGCFPVANTVSYQHLQGQLRTSDSKYIVLNPLKSTREQDTDTEIETCPDLDNFEFLEGEVYTVNVCVIPNDNNNIDETSHEYDIRHEPCVYRLNDLFYNLKLRMSREFYSDVKSKYGNNAFSAEEYKQVGKYRVAIKDCLNAGILESYPVRFSRDLYPVFHNKFTFIVKGNSCKILDYGLY